MAKQLTFRQYRRMDLLFFTASLALCEALIALASNRWFPGEPYTLSITAAVCAIVYIRWGVFGAIPALAGGLAFSLASGAAAEQYVIYLGGNLLSLLILFFIRKLTWKKICADALLSMLYGFLTCLLMQLGRIIIALSFGKPIAVCIGFITTDILSLLFAVLLAWVARRLDGILEEQKHYLFRVQKEMEKDKED